MFHYSSKTTIFFVTLLSSSFLSAASPAELGRECAQTTMTGLIQLIKYDYNGMQESQAKARSCIEQAVNLSDRDQRRQFLQAGIATLESMNLVVGSFLAGAKIYHLNLQELAYASLCKYFGIELLKELINTPFHVAWRGACAYGYRTLLPDYLPFMTKQGECMAFARAATLAYCDAYALSGDREETVARVADQLVEVDRGYWPNLLPITNLAIELIYGNFGDRVAAFVIGAHLFAPNVE